MAAIGQPRIFFLEWVGDDGGQQCFLERCTPVFIYGDPSEKYLQYLERLIIMPKQSKLASRVKEQSVDIPAGTYFCENILDLKIERGQRFYLIKWKGYDHPQDNTWEPLCNLEEYMLEDLLNYEVEHAEQIAKVEGQWREMYHEGKVAERLQRLNMKEMRERLERMKEESDSGKSTPPRPTRMNDKPLKSTDKHCSNKVKHITKTIEHSRHHSNSNKRELRSTNSVKVESTHEPSHKKKIERRSELKKNEREERKEREEKEGRKVKEGRKAQRDYRKKKGRRFYKFTSVPKVQQESGDQKTLEIPKGQSSQIIHRMDIASLSDEEPPKINEIISEQRNQNYFTPEKVSNNSIDEAKKTKSQQHDMKDEENLSEERVDDEAAIKEDQEDKDFMEQSQQEREKLNNQINSYFQDFGVENSVAEVLSRRIVNPPPPVPPIEEIKRESLSLLKKMSSNSKTNDFKYMGNSRGGASSYAVDPSNNKFIMYRKRKNKAPERPPAQEVHPELHHPPPSIMKHLPTKTIIELDEEQKESSPVNSVQKHKQVVDKEEENNEQNAIEVEPVPSQPSFHHEQHESYHSQFSHHQHSSYDSYPSPPGNQDEDSLIRQGYLPQQILDHKQRLLKISLLNQARSLENQSSFQAEKEHLKISQIVQLQPPKDIVQRIFKNEVPTDNKPIDNQENPLESINAILDRFQNKSKIDAGHNLEQPPAATSKKEAEMISIDDDSSSHHKRRAAHPTQGYKFCVIPDKFKRIKKDQREGVRRGIVGRSEESLVQQEGEGTLHYRPSLNTLFQSMLSAREVQLLQSPKVIQLTSSFRLENVIIFSAQVQITPDKQPEARFISYQTMREHYPGELLTFLEDNGMIEL